MDGDGDGRGALDIGALVWERKPDDGDYAPRGGMVVDLPRPGWVVVARAGRRQGKATIEGLRLATATLDPALTQPASSIRCWTMARTICEALGARASRRQWTDEELTWLDRAIDLARVPVAPSLYADLSNQGRSPTDE